MLIPFAADYLKHYICANSRHGTHSPFVYHLVDKVIYDFPVKKVYASLEAQRKKRLNDDSGAEKLSGRPRTDQLLYRLAAYHAPRRMILFGSGLTITGAYLSAARPGVPLRIVEVQPEDTLLRQPVSGDAMDWISIQGINTKEAVLHIFGHCLPHVHDGSLLLLEGIYRNKAMKEAWQEIRNHPQVTVTVDLFWLGLVYFRKGQVKEHFRIRF